MPSTEVATPPDAPDHATLRTELRTLEGLRTTLAVAKQQLAGAQARFDQENAATIELQKLTEASIKTAETNVRMLALAAFAATRDRKPAPGCEIKAGQQLRYDPAEAFQNCLDKGVAIVPAHLDVEAFETIVKASPDSFPFVTIETVHSVQITKNLTKALEASAS
jgi:hypothetical protein